MSPRSAGVRVSAPAWRAGQRRADDGSATVEFVFAGVLLLVPLLYLVLAVSEVQRNAFAVTQAAREAGRAYVTAGDSASATPRAVYAVQLALADQGLTGSAELHWGPVGAGCEGPSVVVPDAGRSLTFDSTVSPTGETGPALTPGSQFEICVRRSYLMPGVPSLLDAGRNTVEGRFLVRVDDLRGEP